MGDVVDFPQLRWDNHGKMVSANLLIIFAAIFRYANGSHTMMECELTALYEDIVFFFCCAQMLLADLKWKH